jgi:hypothetical protein
VIGEQLVIAITNVIGEQLVIAITNVFGEDNGARLCMAVQGCARLCLLQWNLCKGILHSWSCDLEGGSHVTIQFLALLLFCAKSLSQFKVNFTQNKIQA